VSNEQKYHKLLVRQLKKHKIDDESLPDNIKDLLKRISDSYNHYELEYNLIERSIDISSEELIEANQSLRESAKAFEASNKELSELAYAMSHDLKEPLRSIKMHLQMIEKLAPEVYNDRTKEYFDHVIESSQQMYSMLTAMLNYAIINNENIKHKNVDLNMVLEKVERNLLHQIINNNIQIIYDSSLPIVLADETQMLQLFQNLISNSIKFNCGNETIVRIECYRLKNKHHFSITDNGPGILMENPDKLFEMFKTYHPDESSEGIGMGLAICKKIVANHSGTINFDKEYKEGCRIQFNLPV